MPSRLMRYLEHRSGLCPKCKNGHPYAGQEGRCFGQFTRVCGHAGCICGLDDALAGVEALLGLERAVRDWVRECELTRLHDQAYDVERPMLDALATLDGFSKAMHEIQHGKGTPPAEVAAIREGLIAMADDA